MEDNEVSVPRGRALSTGGESLSTSGEVCQGVSTAVGWGGGVLSGALPEEGLPGGRTWWRHGPYSTPLHRAEGMEPGT